jgi:hypothetical protein
MLKELSKWQISKYILYIFGLSYIYFGLVPNLLSMKNTSCVALGAGLLVVGTFILINQGIKLFNWITKKEE